MFILSDNISSPLGWTTPQHFEALRRGHSGVRQQERPDWTDTPIWAALFDHAALEDAFRTRVQQPGQQHWTRFEKIVLLSLTEALQHCPVRMDDPHTIFILSSTKGNVALLEQQPAGHPDLRLAHTAAKIAAHWGAPNRPLVVSQACISGLAAVLLAKRLLDKGTYRHAVVCGADEISRFIWSGFQSFQALSDEPCRPFDSRRKGLNLGEGSATLVFSNTASSGIRVAGAAVSNDANHISGPSRSGAELSQAIGQALEQARRNAGDVDFISAHGTATPYNDEMEAKAFDLSGLHQTPLNSLKGYFGHTLGAAGLIESVVSIQSLRDNIVLPTLGYEQPGVSRPVEVCHQLLEGPLQRCLKTASGFGGCNAAVLFEKN